MADAYYKNIDEYYASKGLNKSAMKFWGLVNNVWRNQYNTYKADVSNYNKDRELQEKEFDAVSSAVKTENYSTAMSDDTQARAVAAEEKLLGKRLASMGRASLFGGLK